LQLFKVQSLASNINNLHEQVRVRAHQ